MLTRKLVSPLATLSEWVAHFRVAKLPVLGRTATTLQRMAADQDAVTASQVSETVLHDPLMTLKVLQYLQQCRRASQKADITTIAHALMMLGLSPFFRHFGREITLQASLSDDPGALEGAMGVCSRARHAALYARDWAALRHDLEIDEVIVAALLHDLAELLLWCIAPGLAGAITERQRADPRLRSAAAQEAVLGIRLADLQMALAREWQLPELLHDLMDDRHAHQPRVQNVSLAVSIARHTASGWHNPALPDDFGRVGRLLGISPALARERVVRVAVRAAADWPWYGVLPAAAWLPLLPEATPTAEIPA